MPEQVKVVIDDLPVEIMVEVASNLDFASFDNMLLVNKRLRSILETYWAVILRKIIEDEFEPDDGFLAALDHGQVTFKHGVQSLASVEGGMQSALSFCRVVKLWEGEFQRLRFFDLPAEQCRSFLPHELQGLRQGLYIWRKYALRFHQGKGKRNRNVLWLKDIEDRCKFMRQFSAAQLDDAGEVWHIVKLAVGREVCPSVKSVMKQSGNTLRRAAAERIGWGEGAENDHILSTIMRLLPEDILHLLLYRHRYATKTSVIQFARMRNPWIEESTETLSFALRGVEDEPEETLGFDLIDELLDHGGDLVALDERVMELGLVCDWDDDEIEGDIVPTESYVIGELRKGRLVPSGY
ncbi:hypothetical protein QBC43DRAFT_288211 [Cladorrhinum sp. PSN259]|nr:hypothetical protein QBC43DRAFT_288211 [Cladorrhinum sp. PSN259]